MIYLFQFFERQEADRTPTSLPWVETVWRSVRKRCAYGLVALVCMVLASLLLISFECALGPFKEDKRPYKEYKEDVLSRVLKLRTQPPLEWIAVQNSLQIVLMFIAFGMDLKFTPIVQGSVATETGKAAVKHSMGIGLILAALWNYYSDIQMLISNDCTILTRLLITPAIIIMSPNYVAAVSLWTKLAVQSPVAALHLKPRYDAFQGIFIGTIGFPKALGAAPWLPVITQIYAIVLFPYLLLRQVLYHVLKALFLLDLAVDVLTCSCRLVVTLAVKAVAVACLIVAIFLMMVTCSSTWSQASFHYWYSWIWPTVHFLLLQVLSSILPKVFAAIYSFHIGASWFDLIRGMFEKSGDISPKLWFRSIPDIISDGINRICNYISRGDLLGIPESLVLSEYDIQRLIDYNVENFKDENGDYQFHRKPEQPLLIEMDERLKELTPKLREVASDDPLLASIVEVCTGEDEHGLDSVKIAVVHTTLQSVVFNVCMQLIVLRSVRTLLGAVGVLEAFNHTFTGFQERTLSERSMGAWAENQRQTQAKAVQHAAKAVQHALDLMPQELRANLTDQLAAWKGVCELVQGPEDGAWEPGSFLRSSPTPGALQACYMCAIPLLLLAVILPLRRRMHEALLSYSDGMREIVAGAAFVMVCFLCWLTRPDFLEATTWGKVLLATLLLGVRILGGLFLAAMIPKLPALWPMFCAAVFFFLPKIARPWAFFRDLQSEHDADSASSAVERIVEWGGVYPKLAQRLRADKTVVRSEALREAFTKVMEHCKARDDDEVAEHLCREMLLRRKDLKVEKTLGAGSVAQVVHITLQKDGQPVERVVKMTWPEDEKRFVLDFDEFQFIQDHLCILRVVLEDAKSLEVFLQAVLSKRAGILQEFDLTREFRNTTVGKPLVEKWAQHVVELGPGYTLTKAHLISEAIKCGVPEDAAKDMSKGELAGLACKSAANKTAASFFFTDEDGTFVEVEAATSPKSCLQEAKQTKPFEFDPGTRRYCLGTHDGVVPDEVVSALQKFLAGEGKCHWGDEVLVDGRYASVLHGPSDEMMYTVAWGNGSPPEEKHASMITCIWFSFKDTSGVEVRIRRCQGTHCLLQEPDQSSPFELNGLEYQAGEKGGRVLGKDVDALRLHLGLPPPPPPPARADEGEVQSTTPVEQEKQSAAKAALDCSRRDRFRGWAPHRRLAVEALLQAVTGQDACREEDVDTAAEVVQTILEEHGSKLDERTVRALHDRVKEKLRGRSREEVQAAIMSAWAWEAAQRDDHWLKELTKDLAAVPGAYEQMKDWWQTRERYRETYEPPAPPPTVSVGELVAIDGRIGVVKATSQGLIENYCTVAFDDGDSRDDVPVSEITRLSPHGLGEEVMVNGRSGRIASGPDEFRDYRVVFDDGTSSQNLKHSQIAKVWFAFRDDADNLIRVERCGECRCYLQRADKAVDITLDVSARQYSAGDVAGRVHGQLFETIHAHLEAPLRFGDEVRVNGRVGHIIHGPDDQHKYLIEFADTVSGSLPSSSITRCSDMIKASNDEPLTFRDKAGRVVTVMTGLFARGFTRTAVDAVDFDSELPDGGYRAGSRQGRVPPGHRTALAMFLQSSKTQMKFSLGDMVKADGKLGRITELPADGKGYKISGHDRHFDAHELTMPKLSFSVKVPAVISHGRHVLVQEYASGISLEQLIKKTPLNASMLWKQGVRWETVKEAFDAAMLGVNEEALRQAFDAYMFGFVRIHGCMLLHNGFGHADPHAGNLIWDPHEQTLWVIDWGATVHLSDDERLGLTGLVRGVALGETQLGPLAQEIQDAEIEAAEKQFVGRSFGIDLWRCLFHPEKYGIRPEGLDLMELKKAFGEPHIVLCLETVVLTSHLAFAASQQAVERKHRAPMSALSLWDDILDLEDAPPREGREAEPGPTTAASATFGALVAGQLPTSSPALATAVVGGPDSASRSDEEPLLPRNQSDSHHGQKRWTPMNLRNNSFRGTRVVRASR